MQTGAKRTASVVVGILMVCAGIYLVFAAGVMFVLALTDVSGFVTNAASVASFLTLLASGLVVGFFGIRTFRQRPGS
jgi:hypothetical protein